MKKLLFILLLTLSSTSLYSQVFTQTFVDRCTNEVKIVTANFTNSNAATISFYTRIKTFTREQFLSGELQLWLTETYSWYTNLSPCSTTTQQTQTAQQQAQQAQQQAEQAAAAASAASSAATSVPPNTTTNGSTNANNSSSSTNSGSSNTNEGNSSNGGSGNSEGGSESGGGTEGETKTEETKTEETKSEETKSEEEVKEEKKEEKSEDKEEESKEEDKKEKEEKEKEEKKKKQKMMPIQLKADMMGNQNPLGGMNAVMNIGASQTSIFGDVSYSANLMIWDNLRQFSFMGAYSKVKLNDDYSVKGINAISVGYSNNFSISTLMVSYSKMKPFKNGLTIGGGVSMGTTFQSYPIEENLMISYNLLATKSFQVGPRITYSPALIWTQTPYIGKPKFPNTNAFVFGIDGDNELRGERIHGMVILANSFTVQLTRRFSFNVGWTAIKSTDSQIPLINSVMIGSKLPF